MAGGFGVKFVKELGIEFNVLPHHLAHKLGQLPRQRSAIVTKEGKMLLGYVGAELILLHENEVGVWLLANHDKHVVASECDHLIEERIRENVPQVIMFPNCGAQTTKQSFVLVKNEN